MALTRGQILQNPSVVRDTGVSEPAEIRIFDADDSQYFGIGPADTTFNSYTLRMPNDLPSPNNILRISSVTGSEVFGEWITPTAAAGGIEGQIQYHNAAGQVDGSSLNYIVADNAISLDNNSEFRFADADTVTPGYVAFTLAGVNLADTRTEQTYTLPDTIGNSGQVLKIQSTVGSGPDFTEATLFWDNPVTGANSAQDALGVVQLSNGSGGFASTGPDGYDFGLRYGYPIDGGTGDLTTSDLDLSTGGAYQISGTSVLSNNTLGSGVVNSSLTSVGTLTSVTVSGTSTLNGGIATTSNADLTLSPNGAGNVIVTGSTGKPGRIQLNDEPNTSGYIIAAPLGTFGADITVTLPNNASPQDVNPRLIQQAGSGIQSFVRSVKTVNFIIDGGATNIQVGPKGYMQFDQDFRVLSWKLFLGFNGTDQDGITVDINKTDFATFDGTSVGFANFSGGSEQPTVPINSAKAQSSADLSTQWANNAVINAGDILEFNVTSAPFASSLCTVSLELIPIAG